MTSKEWAQTCLAFSEALNHADDLDIEEERIRLKKYIFDIMRYCFSGMVNDD